MAQDLFPLATYAPASSSWRTALTMATLWGVPMTLLVVFTGGLPLPVAIGMGAVAALLFGGIWTLWFGRSMRRMIGELYAGDPGLVPAPPDGGYAVRVLANLMTSPRFAVGGHLYAGPRGLAFVPHAKNRPSDRAPRVAPWAGVSRVEHFARAAPAVARALLSNQLSYVRVIADQGEWLFRVPEAERVAIELRKYMPPSPPAA